MEQLIPNAIRRYTKYEQLGAFPPATLHIHETAARILREKRAQQRFQPTCLDAQLSAHGAGTRCLSSAASPNLVLASPDAATAEKKIKHTAWRSSLWRLILERRYPLGETGSGGQRRPSNADATQPIILGGNGRFMPILELRDSAARGALLELIFPLLFLSSVLRPLAQAVLTDDY